MILQANIGGYMGRPSSVIAFLDEDTEILLIKACGPMARKHFKSKDGEEASLVSNQSTDEFDLFFNEELFKEAFDSFRSFTANGQIIFDEKVRQIVPNLEVDKITEKGTSFQVSPDTKNENIAVIALCYYAKEALKQQVANSMFDEIEVFSI